MDCAITVAHPLDITEANQAANPTFVVKVECAKERHFTISSDITLRRPLAAVSQQTCELGGAAAHYLHGTIAVALRLGGCSLFAGDE